MKRRPNYSVALIVLMPIFVGLALLGLCAPLSLHAQLPLNPDGPDAPAKLIFVHHSTGENWLTDDNGRLGIALRDNNYFVSDTNYDWGPNDPDLGGPIGSFTDIGHWWSWFRGTGSATHTAALYGEYAQHSYYSRMEVDPGGENEIIMFKSCFPNSALQGNPDDPPTTGENPLRGQGSGSEHHTVGNGKGIYNDLLAYFATRQDKLFVVIAAPPLRNSTYAKNARAFNEWLFSGWLKGYPHRNVAVFDFYNVLTTNGGSPGKNDLGRETGNHHRWWAGTVQHKSDAGSDVLKYPSGDDHPSQAGNLKATGEYVQVLNVFYHCWKGSGGCPVAGECAYTVTPAEKAVSFSGGKFSAKVKASGQAACPTPQVTSSAWIGTAWPGLKKNEGTLKVSVPANTGSTAREGTVLVDKSTLTITQAGAPCKIKSLVPTSSTPFLKAGGDGTFAVTAVDGCGWAVSQDNKSTSWLHVTSGSPGAGTGTVVYRVDENQFKQGRTGKLTVTLTPGTQKRVFTVRQR
jgi:hypothetical protein